MSPSSRNRRQPFAQKGSRPSLLALPTAAMPVAKPRADQEAAAPRCQHPKPWSILRSQEEAVEAAPDGHGRLRPTAAPALSGPALDEPSEEANAIVTTSRSRPSQFADTGTTTAPGSRATQGSWIARSVACTVAFGPRCQVIPKARAPRDLLRAAGTQTDEPAHGVSAGFRRRDPRTALRCARRRAAHRATYAATDRPS